MDKINRLKTLYNHGLITAENVVTLAEKLGVEIELDSNGQPIFGEAIEVPVNPVVPSGSSDNVWAEIAAAIRNGVNDIDG